MQGVKKLFKSSGSCPITNKKSSAHRPGWGKMRAAFMAYGRRRAGPCGGLACLALCSALFPNLRPQPSAFTGGTSMTRSLSGKAQQGWM